MKLKPVLITLVVIICLGALGYGGYLAYQKYQKNNEPPKKETVFLEGTVVCLPHKNANDGPQTLECAAGLKTDDEKFYGLSTSDPASPLTKGVGTQKAKVSGALEPASDTPYDIQGIVAVESYELAN